MAKLKTVFVFSEGKKKDGTSFQKCTAVIKPGTDKEKHIACKFWDDAKKGDAPLTELYQKGLVKDYVGTIEMTVDYTNYEKGSGGISQQYISDQKDGKGNVKKDKDGNPYKQLNIKFLSEDVKASDFHFKPKDTLATLGIDDVDENIPF